MPKNYFQKILRYCVIRPMSFVKAEAIEKNNCRKEPKQTPPPADLRAPIVRHVTQQLAMT